MPDVKARPAPALPVDSFITLPEADARAALLVRAFESPPTPPWSAADADWATREAQRIEGEGATRERFIAVRAQLARTRLAERGMAAATEAGAGAMPGWLGGAAVFIAFVLGLFSDALVSTQRINILAPPLLALMAWNLGVYAALVVAAIRRRGARPVMNPGALRSALLRLTQRLATAGWARSRDEAAPAVARFAVDWADTARALHGARLAAVLHLAAAALALGALCSLYARGLAFEYLAGWDSTFLTPATVHALLAAVLGPAAQVSGIALPDAEHLAGLRFSTGAGENAAAWIHLYAITVGLVVLLPRAVLSAAAAWRARRLALRLPLSLAGPYFGGLLRTHSGEHVAVRVIPYSYHLPPNLMPGLRSALEQQLNANVALQMAEPVEMGEEEPMQVMVGAAPPAVTVALFSLTATPERENHGAFVRTLTAGHTSGARLVVMVDESAFRQRFAGNSARLAERRMAWQRMLADEAQVPFFVDLARPGEITTMAAPPVPTTSLDPRPS